MPPETATAELTTESAPEASWEELVATALSGVEESPGWTDCWPTNPSCCSTCSLSAPDGTE
ncbi:hypothetical protein AA958_08735 [Streptomyces sp. CNQ-509]|uniref:hypothetical protein n=1 Tax=unclassified Streptomyces TaxID=2593676 RepID=UPI00040F76F2|nr:hypothetical protein [Streptomyces sp. CNQ-509]AKH82302.1 hypothetical protein AA958_08735 [Streptomyces sp. CNQ-509]